MSRWAPAACLCAITIVWAAIFFAFPAGLFTVDETIQIGGIDAMARLGSLTVENDTLLPGHEALRIWYLRSGPDGLAPQYPSGFALLAAPFWMVGGVKGVMALNFFAALAVATLAALIARDITGAWRSGVAAAALTMAATFLADYAFAVWPHAVAAAISTFAAWAAIRAVATGDWRWSLAVGLALGIGGTIRVDVWFMTPPLAIWAVLVSARPIRDLFLAGIGLAPGLLAASALNWAKFGHFFPASYGESSGSGAGGGGGGAISASGYNMMFLVLICAFLASAIARITKPVWGWAAFAAGIALLTMLDGGLAYLQATLRGFWVLGVDLRDFKGVDVDRFIVSTPEGGVLFYFALKKALVQSMPWLGVLPALWLMRRGATAPERQFAGLLALATAMIMLVFANREWHGGLSSNLRYLLALTPLFAVGALIAIGRLAGRASLGWGAGAGLALILPLIFLKAPDVFAFRVGTEQRLPPILFGVTLMLVALTAFAPAPWRAVSGGAARVLVAASMILAIFTTYVGDVSTNASRRAFAVERAAVVAQTPPNSLVFSGGFAGSWPVFQLPDVSLAAADRLTGDVASDLAPIAFDRGWRVFADAPDVAEAILSDYPDLTSEIVNEAPYRAELRRKE